MLLFNSFMRTIAYNLDEIKFCWYDGFFAWHNQTYGTDFQTSEFKEKLHIYMGIIDELLLERIHFFYTTPFLKQLSPVSGSIEATRKISESGCFKKSLYVTSRPIYTMQDTLDSLSSHFPHTKSNGKHEVHFATEWTNHGGKSKADLCVENSVDVIVEDSLKYAKSCAERGIQVILLDCPWNQNGVEELPLVTRVNGWP